jgi:hypothetical protein
MGLILYLFRSFINQPSDIPLIQPPYKVSFNLTDDFSAARSPLSSTNSQTGASSSQQAASAQSSSSDQTERVRKNIHELTPKARTALERLPKEEKERFERLQAECREIVRKYVTPEEYDLLIKTGNRQGPNGVTAEETNKVLPLMKKIDSMTTAEEKAKLAEFVKFTTSLADQMR